MSNETIERVKRGRPRTVNITDKAEYQKQYYEKNKEKLKGDFLCLKCNVLCSISNRYRHNKRYHSIVKEDKPYEEIICSKITCNKCNQELPTMSLAEHLDIDNPKNYMCGCMPENLIY